MKAPPPGAKPYGWVVEFPVNPKERHVFFIANNGDQDKAMPCNVQWRCMASLRR